MGLGKAQKPGDQEVWWFCLLYTEDTENVVLFVNQDMRLVFATPFILDFLALRKEFEELEPVIAVSELDEGEFGDNHGEGALLMRCYQSMYKSFAFS